MTTATGLEKVGGHGKSATAYDWIRSRIISRDFTPGYRLVLGTIADELHMSVVPVREAIRQLQAQGLVTYERNVGARVAMVDEAEYRYSMEALAVLEGMATALSARHVPADSIRDARAINARMIHGLGHLDPSSFTALNQRFHARLFEHCPNPRLLQLVRAEWLRLDGLRTSTFSFVPDRAQDSVHEHEDLLVLIETKAPLRRIEGAARDHRCATLRAYLTHQHPGSDGVPAR